MIYATREATKKAIRNVLNKHIIKQTSERNNSLCTSVNCSPLPKKNTKAGIYAKAFKNANGAELIYK